MDQAKDPAEREGVVTVLSQSNLLALVRDNLWPKFEKERDRLERVDRWYRWDHEDPKLPRGATSELKYLLELSKTPWLNLVVTKVAQTLYVDGFRSPSDTDFTQVWRTWHANKFNARQVAVHRAALAYGHAYATAFPGVDREGPRAVLRGVSPRRMLAVYADPAEDDWPMYAIQADPQGRDGWAVRVIDDEAIYFLNVTTEGEPTYLEYRIHDTGYPPVVRYANQLDLDGRTPGEVEPLIPLAARIDKTDYDRLLTQHFNSWKIRTVSGLAEFADNEEEANRKKLKLRQDDFLVAEDPDTKFGTLDETPLEGFIKAKDSDVETLAALAQVPATALNGKAINISAEALAELRAGLMQKAYERQVSFGESHAQLLRLAAELEGRAELADDVMAEVTWQDMQVRSMAQAADALGKYAQMLGVPPQALWSRIPGVTKTDVDEWKRESLKQAGRDMASALADAARAARQDPTVAQLAARRADAG